MFKVVIKSGIETDTFYFHHKENADKRTKDLILAKLEELLMFSQVRFLFLNHEMRDNNLLQVLLDRIIDLVQAERYTVSCYIVSFSDDE